MPEREEIIELHTTSPKKVVEEETREIWETENPNRSPNDYLKADQQRWKTETQRRLEDFSNRWQLESSKAPALKLVDAKIGVQLEPFPTNQANGTYKSLTQRFDDSEVSPFATKYTMQTDAMPEWKRLLKKTDEQVQRNAANLAGVIKTSRKLGGDEVARWAKDAALKRAATDSSVNPDAEAPRAKQTWETSELYKRLGLLEKTLEDWDTLLGENPLPDAAKMRTLAENCDTHLFEAYREHYPIYTNEATAPFVKFQLLATMRSLSEKVATQYVARLGNPSLSAAYTLITDVPHSGRFENSKARADELARQYAGSGVGWDFETGFDSERKLFKKELRTSDKVALKAMTAELDKLDKTFDAALKGWRKAYATVGGGDTQKAKDALKDLYENTAQLSVKFRQYQEAVDRVLKDNKSSTVQNARAAYKVTLDGFVTTITTGLLIGQTLV